MNGGSARRRPGKRATSSSRQSRPGPRGWMLLNRPCSWALVLALLLQRPLQERRAVELVRGGRVGNVDDVDGEATRDAVVGQVGREVAGVGFGVGLAQPLLLPREAGGIDQWVGGYTMRP